MIFTSRTSSDLSADNTTRYFAVSGLGAPTTTIGNAEMLVAEDCDLADFTIRLVTSPGSAASRTFDVLVNGADADFSCTMSNFSATCSDATADNPSVNAGDLLVIRSTASGTPNASQALVSFRCD